MGRKGVRSTYGDAFCEWIQWEYAPVGVTDLVVFFVRRIHCLLKSTGFSAIITTNSIKDGDVRRGGLDKVILAGGEIVFANSATRWPGIANLFVSLLSIHKGTWNDKPRFLDGNVVPYISSMFQGYIDLGTPTALSENGDYAYQGSIFLGDGFLLSHEDAAQIKVNDARCEEVIFPVINGAELNSNPDQSPGRHIINFFDYPLERAENYGEAFDRVYRLVKPVREAKADPGKWWQHWRSRQELYIKIKKQTHCFVAAQTTKYLNFSSMPNNYIFTNALCVLATPRWDLYCLVQSGVHEAWARKYSGALKQDLRYSPSDCFETFPFPEGLWETADPTLATIGENYHEYRRSIMLSLWLGLTDIYNLFHNRDLTPAVVAKVSSKPEEAETGYQGILELRKLHRELDEAVLAAYGWADLNLGHDFHEVETLPENDRVRYTISPDARKELLKRLLALNHQRAAEEKAKAPVKAEKAGKGKGAKGKKAAADSEQLGLGV